MVGPKEFEHFISKNRHHMHNLIVDGMQKHVMIWRFIV